MKEQIQKELIKKIKQEIANIQQAVMVSKEVATGEESRSESKWDTRAIEAGYLAGAQQARLNELEQELQLLQEMDLREIKNDEVIIGAIIELEYNEQTRKYFLSPTSGGTLLNINDEAIMVISVFSPIGREALGLSSGDCFELQTPKERRDYTIISLI